MYFWYFEGICFKWKNNADTNHLTKSLQDLTSSIWKVHGTSKVSHRIVSNVSEINRVILYLLKRLIIRLSQYATPHHHALENNRERIFLLKKTSDRKATLAI